MLSSIVRVMKGAELGARADGALAWYDDVAGVLVIATQAGGSAFRRARDGLREYLEADGFTLY